MQVKDIDGRNVSKDEPYLEKVRKESNIQKRKVHGMVTDDRDIVQPEIQNEDL